MEMTNVTEKILQQADNRFVLFPIKYDAIWAMYKKHLAAHWVTEIRRNNVLLES